MTSEKNMLLEVEGEGKAPGEVDQAKPSKSKVKITLPKGSDLEVEVDEQTSEEVKPASRGVLLG
jgi:hypothetical protein